MQFSNREIKALRIEDYTDLINDLKIEFGKYNWINGVGQFGEIKYPGISDIDLLILVKNGYLFEAHNLFKNWLNNKELLSGLISSRYVDKLPHVNLCLRPDFTSALYK